MTCLYLCLFQYPRAAAPSGWDPTASYALGAPASSGSGTTSLIGTAFAAAGDPQQQLPRTHRRSSSLGLPDSLLNTPPTAVPRESTEIVSQTLREANIALRVHAEVEGEAPGTSGARNLFIGADDVSVTAIETEDKKDDSDSEE